MSFASTVPDSVSRIMDIRDKGEMFKLFAETAIGLDQLTYGPAGWSFISELCNSCMSLGAHLR